MTVIRPNSITGVTSAIVHSKLEIYVDSTATNGAAVLAAGTLDLVTLGLTAGTYYSPALQATAHTSVPEWKTGDSASRPTGSIWVKTTTPNSGADWKTKVWNGST